MRMVPHVGVSHTLVIANRILRKENYFLSLLNKNILDLHPPFPVVFGTQPLLTKTMEINLSICILQFVFDSNGHIRKKFVENVQVSELALELRKRFVIMAFMNLLASPFILAFLGVYFIFRYGEVVTCGALYLLGIVPQSKNAWNAPIHPLCAMAISGVE